MREPRDGTLRVVANLDVEDAWARLARPFLPRPQLRRAVRARIAALGSLLRVYCEPDDRLWLVDALDPARLPDGNLPRPHLENGNENEPVHRTLTWGPSPDWSAGQAAAGQAAEAAARVNDRTHTLSLARRLGVDLPGSRAIGSVDELEAVLGSADAPHAWVLKAPLCAAGRHRLLCRPGLPAVGPEAVRRLLRAHGEAVFEPWMERTDDYGVLFRVQGDPDAPLAEAPSFHRQLVDSRGGFLGIEIPGEADGAPFLGADELDTLHALVGRVAASLAEAGYRGPVGIDFWRYRQGDREILHPLGEINARLTFGRVARDLRARLFPEAGPEHGFELRFARGAAPPEDLNHVDLLRPLLLPGPDDPTAAWAVLRRIR